MASLLAGRQEENEAQALRPDQPTLELVIEEGVASLLHERLAGGVREGADQQAAVIAHAAVPNSGANAQPGSFPPTFLEALKTIAREKGARHLLVLSQARRIQEALDRAGIEALWLKGIALGQWLYPSAHQREVADLDLLLPDHDAAMRAAAVLAPLGYALPNPHIAGDLVVHELLAWSDAARLELDLHWDLNNYALLAGRVGWTELRERSLTLPGLGAKARGLGRSDALLHALMHRTANRLTGRHDRLRWLYDIHLLATCLDCDEWCDLLGVVRAASLADTVLDGLHASHRAFGTPLPPDVTQALESHASGEWMRSDRLGNWLYWQYATLRSLPDWATRVRWMRQLLIPDMPHLRIRYGTDGAGSLRLLCRRLRDGAVRLGRYAVPRDPKANL